MDLRTWGVGQDALPDSPGRGPGHTAPAYSLAEAWCAMQQKLLWRTQGPLALSGGRAGRQVGLLGWHAAALSESRKLRNERLPGSREVGGGWQCELRAAPHCCTRTVSRGMGARSTDGKARGQRAGDVTRSGQCAAISPATGPTTMRAIPPSRPVAYRFLLRLTSAQAQEYSGPPAWQLVWEVTCAEQNP